MSEANSSFLQIQEEFSSTTNWVGCKAGGLPLIMSGCGVLISHLNALMALLIRNGFQASVWNHIQQNVYYPFIFIVGINFYI